MCGLCDGRIIVKNKITEIYHTDIKWNIDGLTLSQAIQSLQSYQEDFGPDALLDLYRESYSDDCDYDLRIISIREETDEEAKAREALALKESLYKKQLQQEAELRAYEELRIKLGKI